MKPAGTFGGGTTTTFGGGTGTFGTGTGFGTGTTFGTSQPSLFGQTQTAPFGTTQTSTFGTGTTQQPSLFGQTQPTAGGFGTSQPSAFGTTNTFGGGTATSFGTATTGTSFGTSQPSIFGQTQSTPFGTTQPSTFGTGTSFGGTGTGTTFGTGATGTTFGGTGTTFGTSQPSLFGQTQTAPFGTTQASTFGTGTTQQPSLFGQTQPTAGGFGNSQPSAFGTTGATQPSLFGASQTATGFGTGQTSTFGGTQPGTSWFSAGTTQPSQPSTGFGGFGGGGGLFSSQPKPAFSFPSFGQQQTQPLGQQQQQQQQQLQQPVQVDEQAAYHRSIFSCCKFGDERDAILANLNYIQACWGSGKGFYDQALPPVVFNDKNILYRFKSVGYSFLFNDSNEDGQVVFHIKKPHKKVCEEESQFITSLQNILGKPNIFFKVTGSKALNEEMSVIVIVAEDRVSLRRILATDLANVLLHPQLKPQLDNLGIVSIDPKVKPSPEQLKAYLDSPPAGVDPRVWKKAQEDNPDPSNMIPIPFLGPDALKNRLEAQQKENIQHYERLKLMAEEVANLQNRHANMTGELNQLRRRYSGLSHRSIMAVVRLLLVQKQGTSSSQEEEHLRRKMEELANQLNSPTHFRGRLNELMSHIRMHKANLEARGPVKYSVESATLDQAKEFLTLQQNSIKHLVTSIKSCMEYMQRMSEDVEEYEKRDRLK